jgi:hypothetical protein
LLLGTVIATEHAIAFFQTVTDDAYTAVCARRGQRMDGAFETVENVRPSGRGYLEALVIIVAAGLASHGMFLCSNAMPHSQYGGVT